MAYDDYLNESGERSESEPFARSTEQDPAAGGRYWTASGDGSWQASPGEVPPRPRKGHPGARKAATRVAALMVVGAVAFGGGWAGVRVANAQGGRIVIKQAETTLGSGNGGANNSSTAVAAAVAPTVVAITTEQMITANTWFGGQQVVSGAGSGVILSADGYIITCAHVVEGADTIKVELSDGTAYDATLVGSYPEGDIAVIKIEASGLPSAVLGDSTTLALGEPIYAVGNPEGTLSGTITDGIVSSLDREITVQVETKQGADGYSTNPFYQSTGRKDITLSCIQMSASVSPGNSGGGLFNAKGELIGIVNAKSSSQNSEGLGFAIPIHTAMQIAGSLMESGSYADPAAKNSAALGITAGYLDEAGAKNAGGRSPGVYVYSVEAQSTAKAGLAAGDRIISVEGSVIGDLSDLTNLLEDKKPGDFVSIAIERAGQMKTIQVALVAAAS